MSKQVFNKGQSLVEIMIALSIVAIGALALSKAVTTSIKSSRFSEEQNFANSLAQKKIADYINQKNTDPITFFTLLPINSYTLDSTGLYCLFSEVSVSSDPEVPAGTMALISVDVYWNWKSSSSINCSAPDISSFEHTIKQQTYVTK